ncbi:hypothetical protein TREMEDRAFT_62632 [Tremella mesenterica DSM 1558]|uniref:uncharacterized protein n=1 Tax=Tremella mesenterica (strain ATCC 24925 / CBS 8224 / DSM 1558 / NBRC 9311 / NRRL Y-6157 / RJB 2259-6 / UBC 559-6) TaxID=578456 RepID=UPI0003F493D9|nr:uncharacterized protein TREMEDRAFT_62632 [Tremella mesenterica DSM 1558]EIW68914.1 hypothetical protein TREMEDRAFT_62632 [Tremella mesenterica DSM 1558]
MPRPITHLSRLLNAGSRVTNNRTGHPASSRSRGPPVDLPPPYPEFAIKDTDPVPAYYPSEDPEAWSAPTNMPQTLPLWTLANLQEAVSTFVSPGGSIELPISHTAEHHYQLSGSINWYVSDMITSSQTPLAMLSGEVLAATLADLTYSDTTNINTDISAEDAKSRSRLRERGVESWTEETPRVCERLRVSFDRVMSGGERWPGRVGEVMCDQSACEIPVGDSIIMLYFEPPLAESEVQSFRTAQRNPRPPESRIWNDDEDD